MIWIWHRVRLWPRGTPLPPGWIVLNIVLWELEKEANE